MDNFRPLYVQERLPHLPVNCRWFMSEVACGALTHRSKTLCTIKGTVVRPEWRGFGYGEALVWRRVQVAIAAGYTSVNVYSRYPSWYYKIGFAKVRSLPNGSDLVQVELADLVVPDKYIWTLDQT